MDELRQIGQNISKIRKRRGMTQLDLAAATGMEENAVGRIETGRTNPTVKTLLRIAKALEVPLTELVKLKSSVRK